MLLKLIRLYLIFEYARPQDIFPGLGALKLPLVTTLLMILSLSPHLSELLRIKQNRLFLYLMLVMFVHIPFALNNFWALNIWTGMFAPIIAGVALTHCVTSMSMFNKVFNVWLGAHTFQALWALSHQGRGAWGWLGDENDVALVLTTAIPVIYYLLVSARTITHKLLYSLLLGLFVLAIMSTYSRGAFLGLIAVGIYILIRSPRKLPAIAATLIVALGISFFATEKYMWEMGTITEEWEGVRVRTGSGRWYTWGIGFRIFLDNPLIGVGQGNFPFQFSHYEGQETFQGQSMAGRAAHSIYLQLLPELGIVGILLFLSLLYYSVRDLQYVRALRRSSTVAAPSHEDIMVYYLTYALESSLLAYLVTGMFISALYYPPMWILVSFVVALKRVATSNESATVALQQA